VSQRFGFFESDYYRERGRREEGSQRNAASYVAWVDGVKENIND
jgi:hypothetical protein